MIRLKDLMMETLLKEYIDTDMTKLMAYLNSTPEQKFRELEMTIGYDAMIEYYVGNSDFRRGWKSNEEEVMKEDEWDSYGSFDVMRVKNKEDYEAIFKFYLLRIAGMDLERLYNSLDIGPENIPSWYWMGEPQLVKNQWLVHGTSQTDAMFMAKQGFIRGVKDWRKLGLTTWFDGKSAEKKLGGYNFAYTVEDFAQYGLEGYTVKYGDGTILVFRASGIRSFHTADDEMQTIFNGKTARDIVPIYDKMGSLRIYSKKRKELITFNNHMDAVNWVVNNYDQYRKAIGWEKPIRKGNRK